MYGIINKAIQDLVVQKFGEEKWETIKNNSVLATLFHGDVFITYDRGTRKTMNERLESF